MISSRLAPSKRSISRSRSSCRWVQSGMWVCGSLANIPAAWVKSAAWCSARSPASLRTNSRATPLCSTSMGQIVEYRRSALSSSRIGPIRPGHRDSSAVRSFSTVSGWQDDMHTSPRSGRARLRASCGGGEGGIRTPGSSRIAGFQDQCFRPLSHLSEAARSISERVAPWEVGDRRRARSALTR